MAYLGANSSFSLVFQSPTLSMMQKLAHLVISCREQGEAANVIEVERPSPASPHRSQNDNIPSHGPRRKGADG